MSKKNRTFAPDLENRNEQRWDLTITPRDRLLAVDWKEIWRYRDMFLLFVARNFRTAYKQTILGPLWFIITPVLSVIVYVTVFGGIAGIPTDGVPPILFYLLGISVWGYFASCLSATSNSFVSNADIFGKVYFPRIIMPLVAVTTNLLSFAIQLAIFAAFYIYYVATGTPMAIHWQLILFPVFILILAFMAVGFGMIFSSMTTKYRDLISIADTYKEMADYNIIFTKLDETTSLGNLLNLRLYTGSQLSYVTYGQNVPDDIEDFNAQSTVKNLLGGKK
jgi:lipopolysaccharide transport system permease protein